MFRPPLALTAAVLVGLTVAGCLGTSTAPTFDGNRDSVVAAQGTPTPAANTVQCETTSDNAYFLSHVFLPVRSTNYVVHDQERLRPRTLNRWTKTQMVYFGRTGPTDLTWVSPGLSEDTFAVDAAYVPEFSTVPHWSYERHTTIPVGPYRESFFFDAIFSVLYNSLNSQGGETIAGLSDTARCATGPEEHLINGIKYYGTQSCDHVSIGGQIWAHNLATSAATGAEPFQWDNLHISMKYGMNTPKHEPQDGISQLSDSPTTRARMWYDGGYSDSAHGNLVAIVNGFGQDPYPTVEAKVSIRLGLQGAFMVEHYTQCDGVKSNLMEDCDGYELHVYGKSNTANRCGKPLPLGIVAILVGKTPKHEPTGTVRIINGVLGYENDLTTPIN